MIIKDLIQKYKPIITLSIIIIILTSLNLYMLWLLNQKEKPVEPIITTKEEKETKLLKVDIKGEINKPGLYEVNSENRVMDIINKAGGLTKNADTSIINLSKKVKDEMVILIYSKQEVKKLKEKEEIKIECPEVNDACITNEIEKPLIEQSKPNIGKVSINKATIEELQTISGIGEAKAKAIIEYRSKEGEFKTIEDIKKVNGIGEALFEKIKDNITI